MRSQKQQKYAISRHVLLGITMLTVSACNALNPLDGLMDSASNKVEKKARDAAEGVYEDIVDGVGDKAEDLRDDALDRVKELADSNFGEYLEDDAQDVITASTGMVDTSAIASTHGFTLDNATRQTDMEALKREGVRASYAGTYAASSYSAANGVAGDRQHDFEGQMNLDADFGSGWVAGRSSELIDGDYHSGQGVQVNGTISGNTFNGSSNLYDVNTAQVSGAGVSNGAFAGDNANQAVGAFETIGTMQGQSTIVQGSFGAERQAAD